MNDEFTAQIERYFCGDLTRDELAAFEERIATDAAFRREVEAYEKTVRLVRLEGQKALRSRLAEKGRQLDAVKKIPVHRNRWRAGLAILAAALLAWWFLVKKTETPAPALPIETPTTDTIQATAPALPDTPTQDNPAEKPRADSTPTSKPPFTKAASEADRLFAAYFQPYKDESLEPSVRGEGDATPEEIFLQAYWDGKHWEALAAFEKMEPASKNKGDLQFLQANSLVALGRAKAALAVLENLQRNRFTTEAKWLTALAFLKNDFVKSSPANDWRTNRLGIFVGCFYFFTVQLAAQPFQIGHTSLTFTDPARNNRSIPCEIYYPADVEGDDVPLAAEGGAFPVISFGHGFVMAWDAYMNIWEAVVPEGFILIFPKTETGFSPSHLDLGLDLAFAIAQVQALGQDSGSLFFNRTAGTSCVMGHSMGGGASFLAAQSDSSITAIATLAPAETSTSAIQAAAAITRPALIFAGSNDCVTPPSTHQLPLFDALSSACKTYVSITGGSHCQMANSNIFCNIGEMTCTPSPAISRQEQHQVIGRYLLPWLKFQLKNDCQAGEVFDSTIVSDAAITYQRTCELCPATGTGEAAPLPETSVFPNPFSTELIIAIPSGQPAEFLLYSPAGRLVLQQSFRDSLSLDTRRLASGIYFYEIKTRGRAPVTGKVMKE